MHTTKQPTEYHKKKNTSALRRVLRPHLQSLIQHLIANAPRIASAPITIAALVLESKINIGGTVKSLCASKGAAEDPLRYLTRALRERSYLHVDRTDGKSDELLLSWKGGACEFDPNSYVVRVADWVSALSDQRTIRCILQHQSPPIIPLRDANELALSSQKCLQASDRLEVFTMPGPARATDYVQERKYPKLDEHLKERFLNSLIQRNPTGHLNAKDVDEMQSYGVEPISTWNGNH